MHCAGQSKIFQTILEQEKDKNPTNSVGRTPLHLACEYGHVKVVEIIIQKSADFNIDLNAKDQRGKTAFHLACWNGHSKIAEMLIQKSKVIYIRLAIVVSLLLDAFW